MRINRIFRPRTGFLRLVFLLLAVLSGSCTLEPPPKNVPPTIASLSGGGIEVKARSSDGYITSLAYTDAGLFFLEEQPDSMDSPVFGIEVFDELARTSYNDLRDSSFVSAFHQEPEEVTFTRQFKNAPFSLIQRISRDRGGIYLNCRLVLEEEAPGRSVRFTYLVPVPLGYMFTMPGVDEPVLLDGERAVRFRYGGGKFGTGSVAIPLAVLWKPGAGVGLSIAVPLEINTARVTFNIEPAIHSRPPAGSYPRREEFNYLRITFDLMGIR
ncbi:MAG: hypothetical protein U9P14_02025, partial [Gemmatimonadota bacterium]|nr:hypothetical protein [Gemmatimonadota bacterium]